MATEQELEQQIKDYIIKEFLYDKPAVTLDKDSLLIEEGIIDSLGIFILISFIDEEFKVKIEADEVLLENFETLNAIKSLVMSKLNSN